MHLLRSKFGGGGSKPDFPQAEEADTVKKNQTPFVHEVCTPRKHMLQS